MRILTAGSVIGFGLGGFVDEIVLHQIMQWHNMGSAILPPTTMDAMMQNMRWDGVFDAATWLVTFGGVWMLWSWRDHSTGLGRADVVRVGARSTSLKGT